jgi:hypothetical protein
MVQPAASQSDPRLIAVEQGRQTLRAQAISGSSPSLHTLVLRRKDRAAPTAFLISLRSEPMRLVVPLRAGESVVAREDRISDYEPILTDRSDTTSTHAWPRTWCEAGQCHIICSPPDRACVADRSSARMRLYRSYSPPEHLPMPSSPDGLYPRDLGPGVEPVTGDWDGDTLDWSSLFEGDVLVCLHSLWVFAWISPSH